MSRITTPDKVRCDQCGKMAVEPERGGMVTTGGHWMEGWYTLYGPLNTNLSGSGNPERHFCSRDCLRAYCAEMRR